MPRFQRRDTGEEQRVSNLELFYDLVFVFAVTQVSHLLLDDLSWRGAAHAALALLVVWWAWNYTAWVTNELDTESVVVRLLLLAVMLASLLLAVAIPQAFGSRALLFAASYVAIQIGRHTFLTFVAADAGTIERRRAGSILAWFVAAGAFWLAGGAIGGSARAVLWIVALAIDYAAPLVLYRIPGRPPLAHSTWTVQSAHFAERFELFVIIALGESIVVTGATTSQLELTAARAVAFALAFLTTAAFWWLYFNYVSRVAARRLELADNRTLLARNGYTYLHVVIVAGIIVSAVGNELVIAHPGDILGTREVVAAVAGPTLYLAGHVLFRLAMAGTVSWRRLGGAAGCVAAGLVGARVDALLLAVLLTAVLAAVLASEHIAAVRRRSRGEPSPLERLEASAGSEP